jgi:hypothetical protein
MEQTSKPCWKNALLVLNMAEKCNGWALRGYTIDESVYIHNVITIHKIE